jgi:hypothetical protein
MPLVLDGTTGFSGGGGVATSTALGSSALFTNSTGTNLVAIGYQAGYFTTAGPNVFVGSQAGYTNSTGTSNIGIGYQALYSNTTATNNTAVGYQAGYTNTTGTGNTFLGYQAGYTSNSGSANGNTCLGAFTGYSLTTGTGNCFVSGNNSNAGYYVTTGSNNTILGGYTGNQGGLDIRTSSNYIVLSDGAGNPRGYFGNSAYGELTLNSSASQAYNGILNFAESGSVKVQQYYQKNVTSFYVVNSSAGVYLGAGSTSWASASDERLKDIIEPITNGLTKVASLRAVIGKYKTDTEGTRRSFLIAQDVQAVLPEAISTTRVKDDETNTEYLGVSYTDVIPLLVASIKELKTIVDAQSALITGQAAEIVALKAKVGL